MSPKRNELSPSLLAVVETSEAFLCRFARRRPIGELSPEQAYLVIAEDIETGVELRVERDDEALRLRAALGMTRKGLDQHVIHAVFPHDQAQKPQLFRIIETYEGLEPTEVLTPRQYRSVGQAVLKVFALFEAIEADT